MEARVDFLCKEYEQALNARADARTLTELVAQMRSGDAVARSSLITGLMWLAYEVGYEWVGRSPKRRMQDIFGSLYLGMSRAVDRLAKNSREDIDVFVRDELKRSISKFYRQESRDILVPESTKSDRKKKNLAAHKDLLRDDDYIDLDAPDERPEQMDRAVVDKSLYREDDALAAVDLLDLCSSSAERTAMSLMLHGCDAADIKYETSMTRRGYEKTRSRIEWKLRKAGVVPAATVTHALEPLPTLDSTVELAKFDKAVPATPAEVEAAISV